jgi:site-specific DNA-methyltransferase (adenine-specific)
MDVSKAIDKQAGVEREVVGQTMHTRKGIAQAEERTTVAAGAYGEPRLGDVTVPATDKAKQWAGWGTALKPAHEPIVLARKPLIGTVATNVIIHGTGALNIDGTRVATYGEKIQPFGSPTNSSGGLLNGTNQVRNPETIANALQKVNVLGRWPANFIHDGSDEVVELFPVTAPAKAAPRNPNGKVSTNAFGDFNGQPGIIGGHNDNGGSAARFFYCAKASKKDRNEGLDDFAGQEVGTKGNGLARTCATCGASTLQGCECPDRTYVNPTRANHHPTVKPTELMRYLVRLVTPPNGTVLDPFMGSGSTGKAAVLERFNFIGIDQSADYLEIATARIKHAQELIEGQLL